jgi:hypothetical protein
MLEIYATKGHAAGRARALKVELSRQVRGRPDRPNPRRSRDDTGLAPKNRLFRLTEQRFLPRNRLLAGRFRPALRFATRGPSLQA